MLSEPSDEERRARVAALYLKSWLDYCREYWMALESDLSVDEQAIFWRFFNSAEHTFLKNRITGTTRAAKEKL